MSRVPPYASGGAELPRGDELEQLPELGDDAIIAQQQGAHAPQPRVQVTEDARSIVISEQPAPRSDPPARSDSKRRDRTEKTVVIRDRRQIEDLRREMAKRKPPPPPPPSKGLMLWVIVGVAAFLLGGLVALLATREEPATLPAAAPLTPAQPTVSTPPATTAEPPSVSIDELPIEGSKKK